MKFGQLQLFSALADELNFRATAARLGIVQPALTGQLQQLEKEIGTALLVRDRRRVELTPAGEVFFRHAREMLRHMDRAVLDAMRAARGELNNLRVAFLGSASQYLVRAILKKCARTTATRCSTFRSFPATGGAGRLTLTYLRFAVV